MDSRIVPRPDLLIMREELAAAVAESLLLRGGMGEKGREMAAMGRRRASLKAWMEGAQNAARGSGCRRAGTPRRELSAARGSGCRRAQGGGAREARRGES